MLGKVCILHVRKVHLECEMALPSEEPTLCAFAWLAVLSVCLQTEKRHAQGRDPYREAAATVLLN